jgi:hypothetical protein
MNKPTSSETAKTKMVRPHSSALLDIGGPLAKQDYETFNDFLFRVPPSAAAAQEELLNTFHELFCPNIDRAFDLPRIVVCGLETGSKNSRTTKTPQQVGAMKRVSTNKVDVL